MAGAPAAERRRCYELPLAGTPVRALVTTALAGDVGPGSAGAAARRARVLTGPWTWTTQVHGGAVYVLSGGAGAPGSRSARAVRRTPADGLVAPSADSHPAMFAADCALVGLASADGLVGLAHCGWRGLLEGVLQSVAVALRQLGAGELAAVRGPCISPECYEFGEGELAVLERRYGSCVRAESRLGRPALDLAAGVRAAAAEVGVASLVEVSGCTACVPGWFSYRARGEGARQALVLAAAA